MFSRKKVEFGKQVNFCGYLIDEKGCHPSPKKIETIQSFSSPTDESQLRTFLGMANQFCHYHPDLSQTCKPLRQLLKKENEWDTKTFTLTKKYLFINRCPANPCQQLKQHPKGNLRSSSSPHFKHCSLKLSSGLLLHQGQPETMGGFRNWKLETGGN